MNKSLGIGISLAIIIGIIAVATITSMSSTEETISEKIPLIEEVPVEETVEEVPVEETVEEVPVEETVEEETESQGRELTVEFEEKIGFKNS